MLEKVNLKSKSWQTMIYGKGLKGKLYMIYKIVTGKVIGIYEWC